MNRFDDRRKGFETGFARDRELEFRIAARRNRLLGLWAADKLGLAPGAPAEAYAKTVVEADFAAPGAGDVIEKVTRDLAARGVDVAKAEVQAELARAAMEARRQLGGG